MLGQLPAALASTVVVSEVFGPTLQGEGPSIGMRAAFVRLGGCNLHCVWCDTPYTWDATRFDLRAELTRRTVSGVVAEVAHMEPQVVVVTGGEPLLWQGNGAWPDLIGGLNEVAPVEVETNGTIEPSPDQLAVRYNVSPKLSHAGDPARARLKAGALRAFAGLARVNRAALKVVVKTPTDVRSAARLARWLDWPMRCAYVMPEATHPFTLARRHAALADVAVTEGINMTTRLHVLAWGSERGR